MCTQSVMSTRYAYIVYSLCSKLTNLLTVVQDITRSTIYFFIQLPTWIRIFWMLYKLPGPPAKFLLGHANAFLSMYKFMGIALKWQEEFPLFHKAYLMFYPLVMVYAPEAVQLVLSKRQKHVDKGKIYDTLLPMLGEGLVTCKAAKWSRRRKLLTPAFHFNILETFFEVFKIRTHDFIEELRKGGITEQYKDICPFARDLTLNIICETALGLPGEERMEQIEIVRAMQKLEEIAMYRCIYPWLLCDWLFKLTRAYRTHERKIRILNNFTDKIIRKRQQVLQAKLEMECENFLGEQKNSILIDILLTLNSDGQGLTNEDVREEIKTFMFAGHNTTYLAISFSIYLLGRYPEIQKKALEEVDSIFGDSNRDPTMDDLRQLKYVQRCIKDTLRLYPSVPVIARSSSEDQPIGDYTIPKDSDVIIIPYIIHRNPKQFPDPERFNPDNFLPENVKVRHPYSYIPFSAGPRNCIGKRFADMVMLTAISWVLRHFTIHSLHKQEDIKVLPKTVLEPVHGLQVKLTPRKSNL